MDVATTKTIELPLLLAPEVVELLLDRIFSAPNDDCIFYSDDMRRDPSIMLAIGQLLLHQQVNRLMHPEPEPKSERES